MTSRLDPQLARKRRTEILVGRYVANPATRALTRLRLVPELVSEIETTRRKSGKARRVPVAAAFDDRGAWLIAQHGSGSGWVLNLVDDPHTRLLRRGQWIPGQARLVPDDDVRARALTFVPGRLRSRIVAATFQSLQTDPVSVRVEFDRPASTDTRGGEIDD